MKEAKNLEISFSTILSTAALIVGLYLLYRLQDLILMLFIVFLFMTAVNPLVNRLVKHHLPRSLSIALTYLAFMALIFISIASVIPPLTNQLAGLLSQVEIPEALNQSLSAYNLQDLQILMGQLTSLPKILQIVFSAFSSVVIIITFGVITFYLLMERPRLHRHLIWLFGHSDAEAKAETFVNTLEDKIGGWVRGELTLMAVIGVTTFIGLTMMNVSFALPLAIIAGLLELVPNIGPTLSALPAVAIAYLLNSPAIAVAVVALYILIQQLENNFIVPLVMKKVVGINPLITIILIMIGLRLDGIRGAILAIPLFLVTKVVWHEWRQLKNTGKALTKVLEKNEFGNE